MLYNSKINVNNFLKRGVPVKHFLVERQAGSRTMSSFIAFRSAAISLLKPRTHRPPCPHHLQTRTIKQDTTSKTPPRDEKIEHRIVQLVDPLTGRLTDPLPLRSILATLDRRKKYVELVSLTPAPLVKIFDKQAETQRAAEAQYKARAVARRTIQKEVQLTWSAAPGDLAHKLEKVRQELERGARVDLIFTRKKNQPHLPPEEMQARAQEIVDSMADVAKEWKDREVRASMTAIFLQGTGEPVVEVGKKVKKLVVHKGPKPKKENTEDGVEDMYQD
ncbi:hypothetical protein FPV67DRAFT_1469575 [Lyophyllum atratum]|nr:hypothetical protein FPV67DRAFT_1469575 [Lyophyllum atratum]